MTTQHMIRSRSMQDEADFWRMRDLLIASVPITPVGFNWDVRRLDGQRFYEKDPVQKRLLARPIQLWEVSGGNSWRLSCPKAGAMRSI